uniref:Uncharacterized protein n=1 Tax=Populus trichocarpa TaxID=3694 RepID=A0A2K1XCK8_POPTR
MEIFQLRRSNLLPISHLHTHNLSRKGKLFLLHIFSLEMWWKFILSFFPPAFFSSIPAESVSSVLLLLSNRRNAKGK